MLDDIQPPLRPDRDSLTPTEEEKQIQKAFKKLRKTGVKKGLFARQLVWWRRLSKNQRFGVASAILLVFGVLAIGIFYFNQPSGEPSLEISKNFQPPAPATVPSPLTGLQVSPEEAARPVTAVMIENSLAARPQSGLREAGVIFEAIAEGGITRFMALYQEASPKYIGPVRSLRPYYIDWFVPFDASIAHVGGSPTALKQVRNGLKDLDQFFNAGAYWRVSSRAAPHNMYTSFKELDKLNKNKKYASSSFSSWPRKEATPEEVSTAKTITFNISGPLYNVKYVYDPDGNFYLRSVGGNSHNSTSSEKDRQGKRIKPKVVIALVLPYSINGRYSVYDSSGKGTAFIFQDGKITKATWRKKDRLDQFKFTDSEGNPVSLNAGQVWLTAVGSSNQVKYSAK